MVQTYWQSAIALAESPGLSGLTRLVIDGDVFD